MHSPPTPTLGLAAAAAVGVSVLAAAAAAAAAASAYRKAAAVASSKATRARVTAIFIHPIKSCAALPLPSAWVGPCGFEFDRQWIVYAVKKGELQTMMTLRDLPRMALIHPRLVFDDPESSNAPGAYSRGGHLALSAPGMAQDLVVPFRSSFEGLKATSIEVFNDTVSAIDEGDVAAKWLSTFLQVEVRLFVKDPRVARTLDERHTPDDTAFTYRPQTAFSDVFPFLLASTESLSDVNRRLSTMDNPAPEVGMRNFRPNLVVGPDTTTTPGSASGKGSDAAVTGPALGAYDEESWRTIRVSGHRFYVASRCLRCEIPGVDPVLGTSSSSSAITRALSRFRRVDPGAPLESCFGMHAAAAETEFRVAVGDPVVVDSFDTSHNMKVGIWRPVKSAVQQ
ncbi:hypothetical protein HK405_011358 [Cladochytrium tenue]|nr:hypothetical protein HK405_011358 [Cladochytrium tenue]